MSIYWICDGTDEKFEDYDAAWEDFVNRYLDDNIDGFFHEHVTYKELLTWAMKQDAFWDDCKMQEHYDEAEQEAFNYFYIEHDEEDEE